MQVAKELVTEENLKEESRRAAAKKRREPVSRSKKKGEEDLLLLEYENRVVFNKGVGKEVDKVVEVKKKKSTVEKLFVVEQGCSKNGEG